MEFFCGLDVGVDETAICVVDDKSKTHLQATALTDPDAIRTALQAFRTGLRRVGHEAGALSRWLRPELLRLGLPAVCLIHGMCGRRCRRSATRPTRPMPSESRISCAPAGAGRRISRRKPAIGCG